MLHTNYIMLSQWVLIFLGLCQRKYVFVCIEIARVYPNGQRDIHLCRTRSLESLETLKHSLDLGRLFWCVFVSFGPLFSFFLPTGIVIPFFLHLSTRRFEDSKIPWDSGSSCLIGQIAIAWKHQQLSLKVKRRVCRGGEFRLRLPLSFPLLNSPPRETCPSIAPAMFTSSSTNKTQNVEHPGRNSRRKSSSPTPTLPVLRVFVPATASAAVERAHLLRSSPKHLPPCSPRRLALTPHPDPRPLDRTHRQKTVRLRLHLFPSS